jgi:hypothetical protein
MRPVVAIVLVLSVIGFARADDKVDLARTDIRNLTKAMEAYVKARGNAPAKLADLQTAGYVDPKATLNDPWGNPYRYDPKGKKNGGKRPDIWAVTPDRTEIGNWPEQQNG